MKTINTTDIDVKVDGLAAFENLLRVEANLLMSFEDLLDAKYKDMEFPWNPQAAPPAPVMQRPALPVVKEVQAPPTTTLQPPPGNATP
jgi:hypothetical protein